MSDPIPEGYITLVELRELYLRKLWNGGDPASELTEKVRSADLPHHTAQEHIDRVRRLSDMEWKGLVEPFRVGRIEALVRAPDSAERIAVPKDAWANMSYPERPFLGLQIVTGLGEYWDAIAGRVPFARLTDVRNWLGSMDVTIVKLLGSVHRLHVQARDIVLGLAQDGIVAPDEAEAMAKQWGLPPFQESPNAARLDPLTQANWTLPMALAWLAWRTPEAVRNEWDDYRRECWRWRGFHRRLPIDGGKSWREVHGFELVQLGDPTARELSLTEALDIGWDNAILHMSVKAAREALWNALANGILVGTAADETGNVVSIPPREWAYLELAYSLDSPDYLRRPQSLQPVYRNLIFSSKDVMRLWKPMRMATPHQVARPFEYPNSERYWPLVAACVWVGAEGQSLTTDQIANAAIDEIGARPLFSALNGGFLMATGVNRDLIRETIPSPYWEMATLDPSVPGHVVSFVDEAANGLWGTMTPSGDSEPRWSRISIEASALKKTFPFSKSQPASCRKWLVSEMRDSPMQRPRTKAEYFQMAQDRYKVSQSAFARAWEQALADVPEAKQFWTKGGRPKNTPIKPSTK